MVALSWRRKSNSGSHLQPAHSTPGSLWPPAGQSWLYLLFSFSLERAKVYLNLWFFLFYFNEKFMQLLIHDLYIQWCSLIFGFMLHISVSSWCDGSAYWLYTFCGIQGTLPAMEMDMYDDLPHFPLLVYFVRWKYRLFNIKDYI